MTTGVEVQRIISARKRLRKEGKRYERGRQTTRSTFADPAAADGWPSRPSVWCRRPMPDSLIDYSNVLPLSSH